MILALALWSAWAQDDHTAFAPTPLVAAPTAVPNGPPRTVDVSPDHPLQAVLAELPPGSLVRLQSGTYPGPLRVDRPLRIEGNGAVIRGDGTGTVIVVAAPDVTVRDLTVEGSGENATQGDAGIAVGADGVTIEGVTIRDVLIGIDFRMAHRGVVRGCHLSGRTDRPVGVRGDGIRLWESDHNRIEDNTLDHVRDMVVWYSEHNTIRGNRVTHSRYGVHFMHADDNVVEDNEFRDDIVGIFVMYSYDITLVRNLVVGADGAAGVGFGFKESDRVVVRDNNLSANTTGLYLDTTPQRLDGQADIANNLVAYNQTGVRFHGIHPGAHIHDNRFHENPVQVAVDGGVEAAEVDFDHNHWSDYTGYDLDGDGIGDLPYEPRRLSRGLMDRRPVATFFDGTPAATLLDFLGAAFPMWTPPPLLHDRHPVLTGGGLR